MAEHEGRDVVGLLRRERPRGVLRHVVPHEGGHGPEPVHARASIERCRTPQRREGGRTGARGSVTGGALLGVERGPALRARGLRRREFGEFYRWIGRCADRRTARKIRDVSDQRDHLPAVVCRRLTVHAVKKTFGQPVLQRDHASRARVPLRKLSIDADEAAAFGLRPARDVTRRAVQIRNDITAHMRARVDDQFASVADQIAGCAGRKRFLVVRRRPLTRACSQRANREKQRELFHAKVSVR